MTAALLFELDSLSRAAVRRLQATSRLTLTTAAARTTHSATSGRGTSHPAAARPAAQHILTRRRRRRRFAPVCRALQHAVPASRRAEADHPGSVRSLQPQRAGQRPDMCAMMAIGPQNSPRTNQLIKTPQRTAMHSGDSPRSFALPVESPADAAAAAAATRWVFSLWRSGCNRLRRPGSEFGRRPLSALLSLLCSARSVRSSLSSPLRPALPMWS